MTIGDRIKKRRKIVGLTLVELGDMLGLSKSTVHRYELNLINIPSDKLEKLAKALKTTPAYLMGWEETKPNPPKQAEEIDISHLTEEEKAELNTIINSNFIMYFNGKKDNTEEAKESLKKALTEAYLEVVELSKKKGE